MPDGTRRPLLLSLLALLALAVGLASYSAVRSGLFHRFEADGVNINPRAAVRDDVTYELIVWEEAFVAPWAAEHQTELLQRVIEEFTQRRPNVTIVYTLLDEATAREQLAAAIDAGRPPDVYGTARGALAGLPRQVPASPYLPPSRRSEPPPYSTAATGGVTLNGTVWGWPRALWWDAWLGNKAALERGGLDPARVTDNEWNYDALVQWAFGAAQGNVRPISLDVTDVRIVEQLMAVSGAPAYVDAAGQVAWDEQRLADVAAFIRTLQQSGFLGRDLELMSRTRLEALFEDETNLIGPVTPYLAQSVLQRTPDRWLIVPVPRHPETEHTMPVVTSAYHVFHQAIYQGDDHTRLAAELAAFLAAKSEEWLIEFIGLLPASTYGWLVWHERSPLHAKNRTVLERAAEHATPVPATQSAAVTTTARDALLPLWRSFLAGDVTPEQFAELAVRALERAFPERALATNR